MLQLDLTTEYNLFLLVDDIHDRDLKRVEFRNHFADRVRTSASQREIARGQISLAAHQLINETTGISTKNKYTT